MPVYEYRCPECGSFDRTCAMDEARQPANCPTCAAPARRAYTVPGTRTRTGPLAGAGRADRALVDRARTGEPTVTGVPSGRRIPARRHTH